MEKNLRFIVMTLQVVLVHKNDVVYNCVISPNNTNLIKHTFTNIKLLHT